MGKKVYFLDSVKQSDGSYDNTYGVDDVNAIVSNLVGAGVAPFPSGDTYDVSELNSLTSALVAEGTSLDGLKVSFADNKIHIAQGIGYFENGATIVVDTVGEELDYNVAETLYVYAQYNQALNTCGFCTSESKPASSTGIYVLILATIAADGVVTDKRVIAQSKIATLGRNECRKYVAFDNSDATQYVGNATTDTVIWEQEIDISKFNYIILTGMKNSSTYINYTKNIEDGTPFNAEVYYRYQNTYWYYSLWIRYIDGKLQLYIPKKNPDFHNNYCMYIISLTLQIY